MFKRLKEDIQTVFKKDPAARSIIEDLLCYPGLHAIWFHRIAHYFWSHKLFLLGRFISHIGRWLTGIETHPGANIGRRFFIDHGMGVVIGETTDIGDDVMLYQGVVLGGVSLEKKKRHPTLENNVVVGCGAALLGAITIGEGAKVGAGSVVLRDVPSGATVVGIPGKIAAGLGAKMMEDLEHGKLRAPEVSAIQFLMTEKEKLEKRIGKLESQLRESSEIDKDVLDKEKNNK